VCRTGRSREFRLPVATFPKVTSVIHRNRHVGDVVETVLCAQTVTMRRCRQVKSLVPIEYTNWLVWLIVALAWNVFVGMLMALR